MAFQLHDFEQVSLSIEALDAEGNPASATYAWSTSDDTVIALQGDVTAAEVTAVASPGEGGLGTATVSVDVTDTSDGDVHTATFEIEVVAGDAVTFNVIAGEPEEKPAAEPAP